MLAANLNVVVYGSKDRQVDELLLAAGMRAKHINAADLDRLAASTAVQPDVLIVDQRDQASLPASLGAVKRQHPTTGIVIISSKLDPGLMLEAMRAGVSEWVTDPIDAAELLKAIGRVLALRAVPVAGQVFAFVGAKGGVGTTTIAVNVATCLAKVDKTLLIDLHVGYGDSAMYFGVEPRFSIADALENTHRLDESYLHSLVTRTKAGPDLLGSTDRAMTGAVDARLIRAVVDFAARHYRFVLLDCPRSDTAVLDALQQAGAIVVVANQEFGTVRNASRMSAALRHRYGAKHISVVVSRYDAVSEISKDDVAKAVNSEVRCVFPSDYRQSLEALNKARPLVLDNHNKLSASLTAFAHELAAVEKAPRQAERSGGGLFGRLTGKR
jgi:pilus assembly protein CpaE